MKKIMLILFACAFVLTSCEKEKSNLRSGNKHYEESKFARAEKEYRSALSQDSLYAKAQYNLASSSYKQGKPEKLQTSAKYYNSFLESLKQEDTLNRANTIYNLGNTNFAISQTDSVKQGGQTEMYLQKAADQYKQTLRLNPSDTNAKYNLALVQHLLKKEQDQNKDKNQQQQQQQQQNQQQQQQNQGKQNQQQDKQQSNQQNQGGKETESKDNNSEAQHRNKNRKETERMLEALKNNEKNTLNKIKRTEEKEAQKKHIDKDW